jgi:hypothetical protein
VAVDDEEGIRIKEQAILDLADLLKQTKKAKGNLFRFIFLFITLLFSMVLLFFRIGRINCFHQTISKFS